MKTPILYILSCKHVMPGATGITDTFCYSCNKDQPISDVHVYEWRMSCEVCNYARWTGLAKAIADHLANRHVTKFQTHGVKVRYMSNPEAERVRTLLMEDRDENPNPSN